MNNEQRQQAEQRGRTQSMKLWSTPITAEGLLKYTGSYCATAVVKIEKETETLKWKTNKS